LIPKKKLRMCTGGMGKKKIAHLEQQKVESQGKKEGPFRKGRANRKEWEDWEEGKKKKKVWGSSLRKGGK